MDDEIYYKDHPDYEKFIPYVLGEFSRFQPSICFLEDEDITFTIYLRSENSKVDAKQLEQLKSYCKTELWVMSWEDGLKIIPVG